MPRLNPDSGMQMGCKASQTNSSCGLEPGAPMSRRSLARAVCGREPRRPLIVPRDQLPNARVTISLSPTFGQLPISSYLLRTTGTDLLLWVRVSTIVSLALTRLLRDSASRPAGVRLTFTREAW